jgi:hypothetical protein
MGKIRARWHGSQEIQNSKSEIQNKFQIGNSKAQDVLGYSDFVF